MSSRDLVERRKALAESFFVLPKHGSPLDLQSALAAELIATEEGFRGTRRQDLAQHKRLVRVIGDSLAFMLLHNHTIRTLSRHPGAPASLLGQAEDFEFTLEVAKEMTTSGYIPILCDVTNMLRVGDIVAVASDHVLILECKRSPLPNQLARSGRLARQRVRGTQAAQYLRASRIIEAGGVERQAIRFELPTPRWELMDILIQGFSSGSTMGGVVLLGDGDTVALATMSADLKSIFRDLRDRVGGNSPVVASQLDLLTNPRWTCPSPLTFPVPSSLRLALLEGQALMLRMVDIDRLTTTATTLAERRIELRAAHETEETKLYLSADGQEHEFGPWIMDLAMHTPTSMADLKEAVVCQADTLLAIDTPESEQLSQDDIRSTNSSAGKRTALPPTQVPLALGDDVTYGTVFINPRYGHIAIVYEARTENPTSITWHLVWSPSKQDFIGLYLDGRFRDDPALVSKLSSLISKS